MDKIKKLLSLSYLKKDALEKIVDGFVRAAKDGVDADKRDSIVRNTLSYCGSDLFIDFASKNFKEVFTEEEIDYLLAIHESSVMQKFTKNAEFLSEGIYQEIARFVKDEVSAI